MMPAKIIDIRLLRAARKLSPEQIRVGLTNLAARVDAGRGREMEKMLLEFLQAGRPAKHDWKN